MCCKGVAVLIVLIGASSADVNVTGVWRENFGWQVSCSWRTFSNDSLQSVRLFRNNGQYLVFRPEKNGSNMAKAEVSGDFSMLIDCFTNSLQGQRGKCVTSVEFYTIPPVSDVFRCEVSGERPMFRLESDEFEAFVPPREAQVTEDMTGGSTFNCTSSGLPAPTLVWTVDGNKIPENFSKYTWDVTTKLWHSWSIYTPHSDIKPVTCTPVSAMNGLLVPGAPKTVNRAVVCGASSADVNVTGVWRENFGWQVSCSWRTFSNDSLQSVRLFRNNGQYLVFRPEKNGSNMAKAEVSGDFSMLIDCFTNSLQGQRGKCVTSVEFYTIPPVSDVFRCEVSGERPMFRLESDEFEAFVPPREAQVTEDMTGGSTFNCTSSGLPAPTLVWTVDGNKIPENFSKYTWDVTTKLWHSWSIYTPHSDIKPVTCTPVSAMNGLLVPGAPKTVNRAVVCGLSKLLASLAISLVAFLR